MTRRHKWQLAGGVVVVGSLVLVLAFHLWRTKNISSVQRGWTVAHNKGCFTCHGPGGIRGTPAPGSTFGEAPTWEGGTYMMYVKDEQEIRDWILDGAPARLRSDPEWMRQQQKAVITMPGWRGAISERELTDLIAFYKAVSDFVTPPDSSLAEQGRQEAKKLGCFSCHGPQGRGTMPNVRSFKGYIPSWNGDDFPELVQNDQEIRDWILDGGPKRILEHPVAKWFIEREPIKMPRFRGHITDEQMNAIIAYIHWLRGRP
ncbi:MAG: c-type cytochrome [Candidatus Latescibacteria bacterium]|nr:c-type cytochrome [Candidatus Latescibacterota bacterium]